MAAKDGYTARARYLSMSPSKIRAIANEVRRAPYAEAIAKLEALPHKGAKLLRKVIQSAASNALYDNKQLDEEMLYVRELMVNEGPRLKRMWPRGRGRADRIIKRTCHITVVVDEIRGLGE